MGLSFNLIMPCSCVHLSSRCIWIQHYYPPLTLREKLSPECLLTPPPSPLKTSFPLIEVLCKGSCENEAQLAESGISDDELSSIQVGHIINWNWAFIMSILQVFIGSLIKDHLKVKVCFSKQSTLALDTVYKKVCCDNGLSGWCAKYHISGQGKIRLLTEKTSTCGWYCWAGD